MITLKDFITTAKVDSNNKNSITLPTAEINYSIMNTILAVPIGVSANEVKEFSAKVASLIEEKEFIEHLSDKIGVPKAGENEEQFVARAKSAMEALLRKKLSGS